MACIPHKHRMEAHRVDYLRAISDAMDHPFQSEDGREPSTAHLLLEQTCRNYTGIKCEIRQLLHRLPSNCFFTVHQCGDTVIVPAYGWRAVNRTKFMKLQVEYCDIDDTGNIDIQDMISKIEVFKPKAILVVHNFGTLVDVSQHRHLC